MKAEHLSDAIGNLDEKTIAEAQSVRKKKRKPRWLAWVAAAACIAITVALARPLLAGDETTEQVPLGKNDQTLLLDVDSSLTDHLIAYAKYPEMAQIPRADTVDGEAYHEAYEKWYTSRSELRSSVQAPQDESYFNDFYKATAAEFLKNAAEENIVYSPSNVYMALAMLAELTDGESRQQILELLGAESIETLRTEAKYLWTSNYSDDGLLTTVMANSLWLADGLSYNQETMELIAKEYYASSYSGVMGSDEYNALLRDWLSKQTGGLLKDEVNELSLEPNTVMALASTVYFKGRWADTFDEYNTKPETFHAVSGDTTVDFMYGSSMGSVYWGESYTAVEHGMVNGASMWLILPDEDKTVEDVLSEGEIFDMTAAGALWEQRKDSVLINLFMPKFDVTSKLDLIRGMQNLGITEVFDYTASDFSPMSEQIQDVFVSRIEHAARVTVDEEGCTAVAYVIQSVAATGCINTEEIAFVLDRPFIFVITGCGDQPLFIGVVNQV